MAKSKKQKEELLALYKEQLKKASSVFFIEPNGLTAKDVVSFRKKLNEAKASFHFLKNTLFAKAIEKPLEEVITGKNAAIFAQEDADSSAVAKLVKEFASEHNESTSIKIGIYDGDKITREEVIELADLPSREDLLTKLAYVLNAPMKDLASVLAAPLRDFAGVLQALSEQKNS